MQRGMIARATPIFDLFPGAGQAWLVGGSQSWPFELDDDGDEWQEGNSGTASWECLW